MAAVGCTGYASAGGIAWMRRGVGGEMPERSLPIAVLSLAAYLRRLALLYMNSSFSSSISNALESRIR